ncbi:MAG: class I SAM-dependent methyltransferase [Candidatus Hodarchaeales archaeon]|jgi:ubiquinone/menaquinone biosynthesis C-methylase UbiE
MSNEKNRESWDRLSEFYQDTTIISLEDVHYGPYAPGEKALQVIKGVEGLDILELGCGGGQNAIVLAKWGAKNVTAIDQSEKQLEYAQKLSQSQNVNIDFIKGNVEDLSVFTDASFDLIVSSHALTYVEHLQRVFLESSRVLRNKGRIVICMLHPLMVVAWEALQEESIDKIRCYFDDERDRWDWHNREGVKIATFESSYYSFEKIINGLISAGFAIERIVEPPGYTLEEVKQLGDAIPYQNQPDIDYKFIEINQKIPFSFIVSAKKRS